MGLRCRETYRDDGSNGVFDMSRRGVKCGRDYSDTDEIVSVVTVIECFEASRMELGFTINGIKVPRNVSR